VCGWHAGSGGPPDTAPLALPTTTPGRLLTGVPTPSGEPRSSQLLSLRSPHNLPFVVYNIPTSRDHQSGKRTDLAESWSLATTVYGKPDYAQLFTWTGPEGYPITCTITVDGHVTARLTTHGPWGKIFCQG
jgi:hypothetical protein